MVTMSDIARMAGVSQPTVSRVLNGKGSSTRISAATQKKVRAIAQKLHFRPSFAGRALVSGRTRSIGFMCGNIRNPYYTEMADIAMRMVEERGYHLILGMMRWISWQNDLECFESLLSRGVDGVIYFGSALAPGRALYERMVQEKFPLVCVNHQPPKLPCILPDFQPGVNEAFALLKANGHSRVTGIRLNGLEKRIPFLAAAKEYGFDVEEGPTFKTEPSRLPEEVLQNVRREAYCFAEQKDRPGAVVITSDQLAAAFIGGLFEKGVMVPRDVSVISFDGTRAGQFMAPPLTSVGQDTTEIIRRALEWIFERIDRKDTSAPVVKIPTRLVIRQSVGPNPNP
ncbi:MAG: LacI family DNA-binding transcriptional regulator [Phycisphaerae bacterium]|nr:LacI family DNA-binding transcriptional regulator [Phycisphaerae bacterium]